MPLSFNSTKGVLLAAAVLLLDACGGAATNAPPIHHAGPGSVGYYGTYRPRDLALGTPGRVGSAEAGERVDLRAYLKSQRAPAAPARERPRRAAAPAAALTPAAPVAADSATASLVPTAPATENDARRYAAREQQGSKQMAYRGGDVIVISVSTLLIVLLIVLIVLLLT